MFISRRTGSATLPADMLSVANFSFSPQTKTFEKKVKFIQKRQFYYSSVAKKYLVTDEIKRRRRENDFLSLRILRNGRKKISKENKIHYETDYKSSLQKLCRVIEKNGNSVKHIPKRYFDLNNRF